MSRSKRTNKDVKDDKLISMKSSIVEMKEWNVKLLREDLCVEMPIGKVVMIE